MKRDFNWREDVGWVPLAIIVLGLILALVFGLVTRDSADFTCDGQCAHGSRKCQEKCLKAGYCPYGE